jgi:hypothetical protein
MKGQQVMEKPVVSLGSAYRRQRWHCRENQMKSSGTYRTVQWVHDVARGLLPLSNGIYGTDLGPDPRDACLATKAFGPNGPRLAAVKQGHDPHGVLAYACPVPKIPMTVILVRPKL